MAATRCEAIEREKIARAMDTASFCAMNLIYDYAARMPENEDWRSVERLAQDVQKAVVHTASAILRED